ncbi:MAG: hypothetical protein ACREAB_13905, partial [Blastocatellia bacterium]
MRKHLLIALFISLIAACPVSIGLTSGAEDISGAWNFSVDLDSGGHGEPTFVFKQEADKSVAQEKKPRPDGSTPQKPGRVELKVPRDGAFKVLRPKFAFGKVVKGAPYSATAITEHLQTLSDGNQIIRKNESKLYRDSEGRTRKEQTLDTIGKWTAGGEVEQLTCIDDPVAKVRYSLD